MNIYIPLGIILALICFLSRKSDRGAHMAFLFSMIAVFVFAALRFEFGPDYFSYLRIYESISGTDISTYSGTGQNAETGFLLYLQLFPSFTLFIVVNSFIWILANYLFINKYIEGRYYWIVILYIFFNSSYLTLNLVAMRSAIVAFIFLFAFFVLIKGTVKDKVIYVFLILLASRFHTTALALVPFVLLNTKKGSLIFDWRIVAIVSGIVLISFVLGFNYVLEYLSSFVMDNVESLDKYSDSEDVDMGAVDISFNTFLFYLMSVAIALYLSWAGKHETNKEYIIIYKIAVIAAFVQIVLRQSMIADRYFMCFNPFYIAAIVRSLKLVKKEYGIIILLFVSVISLYIFTSKMNRSYAVSFQVYHTVFEAPRIP